MAYHDNQFRIAPVACSQAQREAVITQFEIDQPLITKDCGTFLGVGKIAGELLVDLYGLHDSDGYEVWTATIHGTRIDLAAALSDKQIDALQKYANSGAMPEDEDDGDPADARYEASIAGNPLRREIWRY